MSRDYKFDEAEFRRRTKGYNIFTTADSDDEGSFSRSECDTCGCRLGGNRTKCILTNAGKTKRGRRHPQVEVSSCDDCIYYAAYGYVPGEHGTGTDHRTHKMGE